jgi:hypothetical protein
LADPWQGSGDATRETRGWQTRTERASTQAVWDDEAEESDNLEYDRDGAGVVRHEWRLLATPAPDAVAGEIVSFDASGIETARRRLLHGSGPAVKVSLRKQSC